MVAWSQKTFTFGIVSDSLSHDKYTTATFLETVLDALQSKLKAPLQEIDMFSDGAAHHFKQKYMFMYTTSLLERKNIKATWHFSATSHGKGAVDGTIKRAVFSAEKTHKRHVTSPKDFSECAKAVTEATTIQYVDSLAINGKRADLDSICARYPYTLFTCAGIRPDLSVKILQRRRNYPLFPASDRN